MCYICTHSRLQLFLDANLIALRCCETEVIQCQSVKISQIQYPGQLKMAIEADPEIYVEGETECTTQEFCISGPYVPNINPETDPDYIVALEHYNLAIQQAEQAITIFTPLYWTRLFHKWTQIAMEMETRTLMFSTLIIACQQLIACMVLGGVAMGLICVFLNFMGPIRIKMFATGIVALIIGKDRFQIVLI